ncbi:POTRA domain, FtsQ-type family protein [uncultured delta proteobacterium]|uniref:POTRA domain, FtsQ-type family protein n=1 Tax=uncultured delta proteobacterium TaxID=34034 RepID=A0A212JHG3_9DELT|nr:POTRA domain, FtsQ-type family protein [uncultured delta proteobacterium]
MGTVGLCLAVVGFLTIGLLYGYRYLTISPYFAVKNLEIAGNLRLTSREVLDTAGLATGMNSLLVSIDDVERRLAANPWIATVSVRRSLPDGFSIRLREKEPRFWMRHGGTLFYADARGRLIVPVSAGRFASFPTLEVEPGAEDLTTRLPELLASLASSRVAVDVANLSLIRLSPGRGVEVFVDNDRLILSIGQEEWTDNLVRLAATLADVTRRGELKDVREVRVHGARVWVIKKGPVV